jgi:hypothetical protein
MDYGWRNPEWAANNHFDCLKSLRSNEDCMERAAPPQTSGMRDVLSLSATDLIRTNLQRSHHGDANYTAPRAFFFSN